MTTLHKKFVSILKQFMDKENLNYESMGWLIDCNKRTVTAWVSGKNFPNRDNAIRLSFFSKDFTRFFNELAKTKEAGNRHSEMMGNKKKVA